MCVIFKRVNCRIFVRKSSRRNPRSADNRLNTLNPSHNQRISIAVSSLRYTQHSWQWITKSPPTASKHLSFSCSSCDGSKKFRYSSTAQWSVSLTLWKNRMRRGTTRKAVVETSKAMTIMKRRSNLCSMGVTSLRYAFVWSSRKTA